MSMRNTSTVHLAVASANFSIGLVGPGILSFNVDSTFVGGKLMHSMNACLLKRHGFFRP